VWGEMSLYGKYINERQGDGIIECDEGFATFRYIDAETVYIVDIYVVPEARKYGHAAKLADTIAKVSKEKGCKYMLGTVNASLKSSTTSLKVLLAYGMSLHQVQGDAIILRKEI
jgi:GNAT superfamily N-acetyltransferase